MSAQFIQSLTLIKSAAAFANRESGELAREISDAVVAAAGTVAQGNLGEQFPVSVVQTGSGTSTNTNMNEVLARLEDLTPRLRSCLSADPPSARVLTCSANSRDGWQSACVNCLVWNLNWRRILFRAWRSRCRPPPAL